MKWSHRLGGVSGFAFGGAALSALEGLGALGEGVESLEGLEGTEGLDSGEGLLDGGGDTGSMEGDGLGEGTEPAEGDGTSNCFCAGTLILTSTGLEPIEKIHLGRRVITARDERSGLNIHADKYRVITLSFVKDGQELIMSFLRPAAKMAALGPGDMIDVSLVELSVHGKGRVRSIEPCPTIEEGLGTVVTGVIRSQSFDVLKLKIEGLETPIETTGNHPIFSEDRHEFVLACTLGRGERLRTRDGIAIVESIEKRYGSWTVHNLEVRGEHQYYVSDKQVLVHNANGNGLDGDGTDEAGESSGEGYGDSASEAARANGEGIGAAPDQVQPGITEQEGTYYSPNRAQPEPWKAKYDQYGRQIGRTDYTNQPDPATHTDPHFHTREYGPGYGPKGYEQGPFPGEYPGDL